MQLPDWKAPLRPLAARIRSRLALPQSYYEMPAEQALRVAYNVMLRRDPDAVALREFLPPLVADTLPRDELVQRLRGSEEFRVRTRFQGPTLPHSLHLSRCDFITGLPRAARILDIGGAHHSSPEGALLSMGYPYRFEQLVIVDLPPDERHPMYLSAAHRTVETPLGPVEYRYHSMADLSSYEDSSFDLVYSGQSIEHVVPEQGKQVVADVYRILAPGGWFALDTPNGRACRLQQDAFIDPDHEVEYTHDEMVDLLTGAGFTIVERKGLNYLGQSLRAGTFDADEAAGNQGVYATPEECYLLAYICLKPR